MIEEHTQEQEPTPQVQEQVQEQEPTPQKSKIEIAGAGAPLQALREQAAGKTPDTSDERILIADSESPAEIRKQAAETKLQTHLENAAELAKQFKEKHPDLKAETPEELKEQLINAEVETGATPEEAQEKYEKIQNAFMALGREFVTWFAEVGIGQSDLTELIDAFFSNYYSGSSSASSLSHGKETAPGQKVSEDQFVGALGHTTSFAEALRQSYDKGDNRLKDLIGFRLDRDNLNKAADGDKKAMQELIIELDDLFKRDEKYWVNFKQVFAQNLYPNKRNIELDDSIKDLIADMVKRDKLDRYVGSEENVTTEDADTADKDAT